MFTKILVATDRITVCDAPVVVAARLAKEFGAALSILHVSESSAAIDREFVKDYRTGETILYSEDYGRTIRGALAQTCAPAMEGGMDYGIDVMPGFPWMMILKTARKQRADLVVMGPHSSRAKEMGVMRVTSHAGSTVQKVIQHERCPVMLVNDNATEDALAFKKILVSTDFSKSCESALAFAVELAREKGSKLVVFHMNSGRAASRGEDATVAMERFCAGIPAEVAHEVQICKGESPQKEILKFMNQVAADLIVMGSHTKEKNGKWYIGSAVEEVSLRAPCSVCIITDPKVLLRFQRD